ncbi:double-strand break repair helicase AddA [Rhodovibrio salinarum]|uniref:DNA 3'-5' helicase n=1 Tax=Rhodovibrio salinarum TaxID=1087 RepID=A0A934V3J1_9PROT|nr:double-strand break repair helicase AddA [Rhodovibrio salinarum]MBK1699314.1 double-strand break repair helicase AddA [Rhodovibrio salinarum]
MAPDDRPKTTSPGSGDLLDHDPVAASQRKIAEAADSQRRAADPEASVWVAASAGTGKTKVLTDRVLSLMLAGTPPAKILCLTFTKAAAAEMANRLSDRLSDWATAADDELAGWLENLTGQAPDAATMRRARQLFAQVLDAPGGMKVQTIHAFCQHLLARFPLEAGVAPHAQVLDERSAQEMLRESREEVLARAGAGEDPELAGALADVTARVNEQEFAELIQHLIAERGRLTRLIDAAGGIDSLIARTYRALGLARETTTDDVLQEACAPEALDALGLKVAEDAMRQGTKTEAKNAQTLKAFLDTDTPGRVRLWDSYTALFFTTAGDLRKKLLNKDAAAVPGALGAMEVEAARLQDVRERLNAATTATATASLLRLGAAIVQAYARHKAQRALLDYDDLILTARKLLHAEGRAAWVLYKLDGGLDHVLIDEAQDTNPEQWDVVQALTQEFFAGEGAAEARDAPQRTVFAVGDGKQSIYSFQRAEPAAFARMRKHFESRAQAARRTFRPVALGHSFRSTDAVLQAVDTVFRTPAAHDGVLFEGDAPLHHDPVRVGHSGRVELWPPVDPSDTQEPDPWAPPTERHGDAPPRQRLARLIAARIERWTRTDDPEGWLPSKGRQMRPGDVLVLVRRRNDFVEELVRELKLRNVPVAGVDRMVLTEQLAVRDLVALGRFLLLPEDSLTLACVLKGPLIGLSEERLFELAWNRGEASLWDALRDRTGENADFERAYTRLADWLARADYVPPYELYAQLLGAEGGRRDLVARLGPEANDPVDEFQALALAYEREHVPSLQGFLHWLEAGEQEVKRDAEHGGNAVRVMTVHGAKGLQAPVVFLPDTLQVPTQGAKLLWDEGQGLALWPPRTADLEAVGRGLREAAGHAQSQEYRRLLYVAMTRAEDRLYVCGYNTKRSAPPGCWYELVQQGLAELAEERAFDATRDLPHDGWQGTAHVLESPQRTETKPDTGDAGAAPDAGPLPDWAVAPPAPEPAPPRPLAPSRAPESEPPVRSPLGGDSGAAYQRGRLVHRLLQTLPDLPASERREAGLRYLDSPSHQLDAAQAEAILEETLRIVEAPEFQQLFGPASRPEVPVVGLLDRGLGPEAASGQIDRLAITEETVVIVDYKTNRPPPQTPEQVPQVYRDQLATYRRLVQRIWPERRVETWLLWTDGPHLMQITDA